MSAGKETGTFATQSALPPRVVGRVRTLLYASISPAEIIGRLKLNPEQVRRELQRTIHKLIDGENYVLSQTQKTLVTQRILDDVLGFGPIESLLSDASVTEIMVNGPTNIFAESRGILRETDAFFEDEEHLLNIIDKIVAPIGRRVDESSPMVDARLPDGSRVNIVIPPVALTGPTVTIRKFRSNMFTFHELVANGAIPERFSDRLCRAIKERANILVTGGTGSGKTTLLNALSDLIPANERIVTIEDAAELRFSKPHVVRLESRPANVEGRGSISIRDLVVNALRMRPDRIVVGEVRGGEALDMLQAMNTGHDGSLATAHANSPREALSRLETMALMAGIELPVEAVRRQIAGAIDLIVHVVRDPEGSRSVDEVVELTTGKGGEIRLSAVDGPS